MLGWWRAAVSSQLRGHIHPTPFRNRDFLSVSKKMVCLFLSPVKLAGDSLYTFSFFIALLLFFLEKAPVCSNTMPVFARRTPDGMYKITVLQLSLGGRLCPLSEKPRFQRRLSGEGFCKVLPCAPPQIVADVAGETICDTNVPAGC